MFQQHILNKAFEAARVIYNTALSIALKHSKQVKRDSTYRKLLKEPKSKARSEALKELHRAFGFSEFELHKEIKAVRHHFSYIGSNEAQVLATRAFRAVEKMHYGKAKCVYFKRKAQSVSVSIEGKNNKTSLREADGLILFAGLKLKPIIKKSDHYAQLAQLDRTKYVRLVKRIIRGKEVFFAQLIKEGIPPLKKRSTKAGNVGIDIGTSTVAVVSNETVFLEPLIKKEQTIKAQAKKIRLLQRKLDRSRRANNPNKYHPDGTINQQNKTAWQYSKRYQKTRNKLKALHRTYAIFRKQSHETLANRILLCGDTVKVETMSFQGLAKRAKETKMNEKTNKFQKKKRFGKSILHFAPAMLLAILDRKLQYFNKKLLKIDTAKVKASQYNHVTQTYTKKKLNERWNLINGKRVQRDLYSAFLIQHVHDDLASINQSVCEANYASFLEKHDKLFQ